VTPPSPAVLIATDTEARARRAASAAGIEATAILSKSDCARVVLRGRPTTADPAAATVVYSPDWRRQGMPQLFELAAVRLGTPEMMVVGDTGRVQVRVARRRLSAGALFAPAEIAAGYGMAGAQGAHLVRAGRRGRARSRAAHAGGDGVLAIWHGSPGTVVGGSVTHVAGVLRGFAAAGVGIHVVTACEPPPQLVEVADRIDVIPPMPRKARVSTEVAAICANRHGRRLVRRILAQHRPAFVYQRYDPFIWYGVDAADEAGLPCVLEWNCSEVWTRANWHVAHPLKRVFDPLLRGIERHVVRRAAVVAAVSERAAEMAVDAGADRSRLRVVPNGVDAAAIDAALAAAPQVTPAQPPRIGWVGSFGSWHGAEVLVRALRELPDDVGAVLVGDGPRRESCRRLAEQVGVSGRIEWTGALAHRDAVARLAGCDVLASPHVPLEGGEPFFGSPTKLFEYMAIGRPIVASRLEQIGEVLEDGRTGRLVRPGEPAELAAAIREVLAMPQSGRALGEAARREALARHTWHHRAVEILQALDGDAPR
jgi:glycosyltransferase involved in cell wall biosynthesis